VETNKALRLQSFFLLILFFLIVQSLPAISQGISGEWLMDKSQSRNADFFDGEKVLLRISADGSHHLKIEQESTTEYAITRSVTILDMNGVETISKWPKGDLPVFGYEAVAIADSQEVRAVVQNEKSDSCFDVAYRLTVLLSQGYREVDLMSHYELQNNGKVLNVRISRDSRKNAEPVVYVFRRVE